MLAHPQGLIAVVLAIISFLGMTYVVMALSMGWRFAYWLAGATFGGLMVMLSIFWIVNPVGPRGNEAKWVPLGSGRDRVAQVTFKGKALQSPGAYPTGDWKTPDDKLLEEALASAVQTCVTSAESALSEEEKEPCTEAQTLMPQDKDIPVINGTTVAITAEVRDTKFTSEDGLLGEMTIVPMTHDPRVAKDAKKGKQMGPSFKMLFVYDKGALRLPPLVSTVIFALFFAFHLAGLNRAEKRKLSPAMTS